MNRAIQAILISVVLVIAGTAYLLVADKKIPTVTLISNGLPLGKVPVNTHGFADLEKMSEFEEKLIDSGYGGLNFAGWYRDASYGTPFNKFTVIKSNTTVYAGWSEALFTMVPADPDPARPMNHETYVLTNMTGGDFEDTTWTIRDAFKTSTPRTTTPPIFSKSTDPPTWRSTGDLAVWTVDLMPGMYDVTMTTVADGKTKSITRTHVVEGSITSKPVTWNSYDGKSYTITYGIGDVNEYIELAKSNRVREFRIPNIASFIIVTPAIQNIADLIKEEMDKKYPSGYTPQELMNVISPFVVSAAWASDSDYFFIKGFHKDHTEGGVEYYKYPIESIYDTILYNSQGDCDCKSILIAAIAKAAGFEDVGIFTITGPEGHATAAVRDPSFVRESQTGAVFFLDPETMDGYFASDGNQGYWRLGYMNVKYQSDEFTIRLWKLTA